MESPVILGREKHKSSSILFEISSLQATRLPERRLGRAALERVLRVGDESAIRFAGPSLFFFRPRTIWSLSNASTSAFKELDPIPQFRATAKLGEFLEARFSQSF